MKTAFLIFDIMLIIVDLFNYVLGLLFLDKRHKIYLSLITGITMILLLASIIVTLVRF